MLEVTFYRQPHGGKSTLNITNILPDDAKFFQDNNLSVSMEELPTGQYVVYSSLPGEHEEWDEEIYIVPEGEACEVAMGELRKLVEGRIICVN